MTLDAVHNSRIGKFQIRGPGKKPTNAYDEETSEGEVDLIYGRIGRILDDAAKTAGLTKTQFKDRKQTERVEPRTKGGRGRSLSKRRKESRES